MDVKPGFLNDAMEAEAQRKCNGSRYADGWAQQSSYQAQHLFIVVKTIYAYFANSRFR
jgi:hypothetical protein